MGRVMKLINSAYYSLNNQITSLVRAIIMLGINTVKNLALSTAVLGNLGKKSNFQALNIDGFWRHSLCVGVTAKLIAAAAQAGREAPRGVLRRRACCTTSARSRSTTSCPRSTWRASP